MKSWKSSLCGMLAAFFGWVIFDPAPFSKVPWLISLSKFAFLGGLAGIGVMSKDFNVHSTANQVGDATIDEKAKQLKNL